MSYVINNGPRPVSAKARARVEAAIADLGYRPSSVARALRSQRTQTLGLLVPDISNPYFAELAKAIEDIAYARGYALLLVNSGNDLVREVSQLTALADRQVDGLLIVGTISDAALAECANSTPVVKLDRATDQALYPTVVVDNVEGAEAGVRHLIGHGYRRIFCLGGPEGVQVADERILGWRRAMAEAGLPTEGLLAATSFTRQAGYEAAKEILTREPEPIAIFSSSDLQAIGALRACYEAGRRVPDDVAVLSFDGTQESEFTSPPLSVVRQEIIEIAATAVAVLLDPEPQQQVHLTAPSTLVLRQSCGCSA